MKDEENEVPARKLDHVEKPSGQLPARYPFGGQKGVQKMSGWELKDLKPTNVDLRLNIFSLLAPLLAILIFYFMVHGARKADHALVVLAIVLAGLTFLLSLLMAIAAILRKEPRRQLSIISLLLNSAIFLLFISRFFA